MLKERKTAKQMLADQRILLLIVIAAVVIFVGIMNPRFLMVENIVAIFQAVSVTGLLTMTMAMLLLNGGLLVKRRLAGYGLRNNVRSPERRHRHHDAYV